MWVVRTNHLINTASDAMQKLRPYQERIVSPDGELAWCFKKRLTRILTVSPCGSGKTTIFAELTRRSVAKGLRVNIIAHRRKLISQIAERLTQFGVEYHCEMADLPDEKWAIHKPSAQVRVCSRDTVLSRRERFGVLECDMLIIDECHISPHSYEILASQMNAKFVIGTTATPCQSDGSGLSSRFWQRLITVTTIQDLLADKWLSPLDVYAPPEAARTRRNGGKPRVCGDPVEQWFKHAQGLPTVSFCRTVAESVDLRTRYRNAGIKAAHMDASMPDEERSEIFQAFKAGEIQLITNVGIVGVGVDIPEIECVQLLTTCVSPSTMFQLTGRAARTCHERGKERGISLDHAASYESHGHPNISPDWTLDDKDSIQNRQANRVNEEAGSYEPKACECGLVSVGVAKCPGCGKPMFRKKSKPTETSRENLSLVDPQSCSPHDPRQKAWKDILFMTGRTTKPYKVASVMFKNRFGVWPDAANVSPRADFKDKEKLVAELFPWTLGRGKF